MRGKCRNVQNFDKFLYGLQDGQLFEFIEQILFLKTYLGGDLAPSSKTVRSLLIPPGRQSQPRKRSNHSSNGFDKLKNLTNLDATYF